MENENRKTESFEADMMPLEDEDLESVSGGEGESSFSLCKRGKAETGFCHYWQYRLTHSYLKSNVHWGVYSCVCKQCGKRGTIELPQDTPKDPHCSLIVLDPRYR